MRAVPVSLRLSREHLQAVLDAVNDAVFTVNRDFVVTSFNRAAERATGLVRADVIGRHCYEALHSTICDYVSMCPMMQLFDERGGERRQPQDMAAGPPPGGTLQVTVHALHDNGSVVGGVDFAGVKNAGINFGHGFPHFS